MTILRDGPKPASEGWRERRLKRQEEWVLRALRRHPTEAFSGLEIAGLAGLRPTSISLLLWRLEERGVLLSRWEEETDPEPRRRVYRLQLEAA